jgi:hypothetical protein
MERHDGIHFHFPDNHGRIMTTAGCWIIPWMRGLIQRLIETTLTQQTPVSYPDTLLLLHTVRQESQLMLAKFKEKKTL